MTTSFRDRMIGGENDLRCRNLEPDGQQNEMQQAYFPEKWQE